jgi:hypothetical protein
MSYRGPKSTTFNGIECLPWGEVFSRCTKGFEEENSNYIKNVRSHTNYDKLALSSYLSHMSPDRLVGRYTLNSVDPQLESDCTLNPCTHQVRNWFKKLP